MLILQLFLTFIGGVTVLLISSQLLLSIAQTLAYRWKLSPLFLALVLVALGTNIPELTFTLTSFLGGDAGLAMGNVVGSNIVNISLVFGIAILVGKPKIENGFTSRNALLMLVVTLFFVSLRLLQIPYFLQGLLLISMAMAILIYQYMVTHRNSVRKGKATQRIKSTHKYIRQYAHYPFGFLVMVLMSAVIGIAVGGYQVILAVQELAVMYDLSQTVLGLTLVAVSTSLPELITILVAKVNHDDEVMVGTILGSNMYNLGLFAGLLSLNQVGSYLTKIDFIFLITSAMLMTFMLLFYAGRKIPRVWGVASIFLFLIFVAQAFILPLL